MKKFKILLVEDNVEYLNVAKNIFKNIKNIVVHYVMDRKTAIEKLKQNEYGGVITDWSIPSAKGESILKPKRREDRREDKDYRSKFYYDISQGYIVALFSLLEKGLPVIMHSYHHDYSTFRSFDKEWCFNDGKKMSYKVFLINIL